MKIKFWCDNNANIHSKRSEIYTLEDLGISEEEWNEMTENDKQNMVQDWAFERFEFGFKELK